MSLDLAHRDILLPHNKSSLCEVLVPIVHRFELAPICGNVRRREKPHLTAEFDKARPTQRSARLLSLWKSAIVL